MTYTADTSFTPAKGLPIRDEAGQIIAAVTGKSPQEIALKAAEILRQLNNDQPQPRIKEGEFATPNPELFNL